ncbi:hypothetical protein [Romboutsia weinsteinii]|nr:hypothetical protein [Romboutsia weinsteinii]
MAIIKQISKTIKGVSKFILVNERINSQRCVAKNLDTTKTIFDNK